MSSNISAILKNNLPSSGAEYKIMSHRSDGQLMEGKGPKPKTEADKKIHFGHIIDSGEYNLRHSFDHTDELAFDFKRLAKEKPLNAKELREQTIRILNPNFRKMKLKLKEV